MEGLGILADGIKVCKNLKSVNLAYCGIPDKCGTLIVKMIREYAQERDSRIWQDSLRPSTKDDGSLNLKTPGTLQSFLQPKEIDGLCEFILHHNRLG